MRENKMGSKRRFENLVACIGILLLVSCLMKRNMIMDDWFWHFKCGEWISKNGFIDKVLFAWSSKDTPWIAHEWLFEWMTYYVHKAGENFSVQIYALASIAAFLIIFRYMARYLKKEMDMTYFIVMAIEAAAYAITVNMRPQYLDIVLYLLFLYLLLTSLEAGKYRRLYFIPVIQLFWVNFHLGTAVLVYTLFACFMICNVIELEIGKVTGKRAPKRWILAAVVSFLLTIGATFVNPYGIQGFTYAFKNMSDGLMTSFIGEWSPPDAKNLGILILFFLPLMVNLFFLVSCKTKIKLHDIVLFFIHMMLFFGSVRYAPVLSIVSIMLIYPYRTDVLQILINSMRKGKCKEREAYFQIAEEKKEQRKRIWEKLFLAAGCMAVIAVIGSFSYENTKARNRDMADILLSDELVDVIKQDGPSRLFHHYNAGGYLIMNDVEVFLYQSYEPFVDSGLIQDYLILDYQYEMEYAEELKQIPIIFEKYDFDGALLHKGSIVLEEYLLQRGDFEVLGEDENYRYYGKIM